MRVVFAPDSFGGTLSAAAAARAIAAGWCRERPDDEAIEVPLADGGEGTLEVLAALGEVRTAEVAGPRGTPVQARWLELGDGSAVIESAQACGLALVAPPERDPLRTTTYGVGQLLEVVRAAGALRVAVGLGGSATVDGGAGALQALGVRLLRADGSGLKIGGDSLRELDRADRGWLDRGWEGIHVEVWADVRSVLADAARVFGPQKGATPESVELLEQGLERFASVLECDLGASTALRDAPGSGAAGGLGYGLVAGVGASIRDGADAVARALGLADALAGADLVVTGEGRLDATSGQGKVVGHVLALAGAQGLRVAAVAGQVSAELAGLTDSEAAAPDGPGEDPASEVAQAAARLAARLPARLA